MNLYRSLEGGKNYIKIYLDRFIYFICFIIINHDSLNYTINYIYYLFVLKHFHYAILTKIGLYTLYVLSLLIVIKHIKYINLSK